MHIRIPRTIYQEALAELAHPHAFAAERVGFFFGRQGRATGTTLMLVSGFTTVDDAAYVDDRYVGARIGSDAIRAALQTGLSSTVGMFHVHMHDHHGRPRFSRTDLHEADEFIRPFRMLVPSQPHGMIVLSRDSGIALVWSPGMPKACPVHELSVVGFPIVAWGGEVA